MDEPAPWLNMSAAPRDGSRILVTVRSVEQGPADVDVAYWAKADRFGAEGWRAGDSYPGCIIGYAEPELKCWMPLPHAGFGENGAKPSKMPAPWLGEDAAELGGSGI